MKKLLDMENGIDDLRGIANLILAMRMANQNGHGTYDKESLCFLSERLFEIVDDIEEMWFKNMEDKKTSKIEVIKISSNAAS